MTKPHSEPDLRKSLAAKIFLFVPAVLNDFISRRSMLQVSDAQVLRNNAALRALRHAGTTPPTARRHATAAFKRTQ